MKEGSFNIYVPSYKRAQTTTTYKMLEYCTYVVRKSEEEEYKALGIKNIWAVEDEKIDSMIKVANFIIENSPEDVIAMMDDDEECMMYRLDYNTPFTDPETVTAELERVGQLIADLDIGYAATDASAVPYGYTQEFEFKGTSGGLRWINKSVFKSRFDEKIGYCCDLNIVLNECMLNRVILKPKYLCTKGGTDTNSGGNSEKMRKDQLASVDIMKHKWGKYFDYDVDKNRPYIKIPR